MIRYLCHNCRSPVLFARGAISGDTLTLEAQADPKGPLVLIGLGEVLNYDPVKHRKYRRRYRVHHCNQLGLFGG